MQVAWRLCFLKGKYLASMIPVITSDFLPFSSRAKYGNASRHHTSRRVGKCTFRCIVLRCCFLVQGWVLSAFFSQIICATGMIGGFIFSCQNNVQLLFALKKKKPYLLHLFAVDSVLINVCIKVAFSFVVLTKNLKYIFAIWVIRNIL